MMKKFFVRAVVLSALACLLAGCTKTQKLTDSEKALFVRAGDLVPYGFDFKAISKHESFNKTNNFDGSSELEYEFETPEGEQKSPLYLYESVTSERKLSDALLVEGSGRIGLLAGLKSNGLSEQSIKGAKKYGDSSSLSLLVSSGTPIGNCFSMRKGKQVYLLFMSGVYIDDPQEWDELIQPKLKSLLVSVP